VEPFRDGKLLDLPVNITLGWKLMASTLPFYNMATITVIKSFIVQSPEACTINLFTAVIYGFRNKLECLSLAKAVQPSLMFAGKVWSLLK
jgi:hypothetical protein